MEIKFDVKIHLSEEKNSNKSKNSCVFKNFLSHEETLNAKQSKKGLRVYEKDANCPARDGKVFGIIQELSRIISLLNLRKLV